MKKIFFTIAVFFCSGLLFAAGPVMDIKLLRQDARRLARPDTRWLEIDTNGDGKVDDIMLLNKNGAKLYEEIDINHDGEMDDLCYYRNGTLLREEVDSNFDGLVDLWVFLKKGVYVERYMRDTDFNGTIDLVKDFGAKK